MASERSLKWTISLSTHGNAERVRHARTGDRRNNRACPRQGIATDWAGHDHRTVTRSVSDYRRGVILNKGTRETVAADGTADSPVAEVGHFIATADDPIYLRQH